MVGENVTYFLASWIAACTALLVCSGVVPGLWRNLLGEWKAGQRTTPTVFMIAFLIISAAIALLASHRLARFYLLG
jgi:hypothetical protein